MPKGIDRCKQRLTFTPVSPIITWQVFASRLLTSTFFFCGQEINDDDRGLTFCLLLKNIFFINSMNESPAFLFLETLSLWQQNSPIQKEKTKHYCLTKILHQTFYHNSCIIDSSISLLIFQTIFKLLKWVTSVHYHIFL